MTSVIVMKNILGIDYPNITDVDDVFYNISTNGYSPRYNGTRDSSSVSKNVLVPSAMFFLGVLGNVIALIILTVRPSKDNKSTAFYHLVKALVCMDLFGIVASSPVTIVVYIKHGVIETGGMALCHYFSFILVMAGNATVFTVLVMAAERYMVTKFPFRYSRVVRPLTVNCCILVIWGLSTLIALLPTFGMGRNIEPWPGTWCFFDYRSSTLGGQIFSYFYAVAGLLAILVTIVLNLWVIKHLWRMRRSRLSTTSLRLTDQFPFNRDRRAPDSEKRMVNFLIAITIVFTVCYAPFMVRIIMNQLLNSDPAAHPASGGLDDTIDIWALRLASLNQILDPWVYIISRVTCCKGSRDRTRDIQSQSPRSHHVGGSFTHAHDKLHISAFQDSRTKQSPIMKAIQNIGYLFTRKRLDSDEKEAVTIPLQPTLLHTIATPSLENGDKRQRLKEEFCT